VILAQDIPRDLRAPSLARQMVDEGGWGLHMVETLSRRWGVREGSTHVWFELPSGSPSGS
jgi:hypothetical protein